MKKKLQSSAPEFDLDKDFEELLSDFKLDEDDNAFDDDLPEPDSPLYRVLQNNGIYHTKQRKIYEQYDISNIGCSVDNPIIINETEDYVRLEYELLEYILRPSPYRFVDYEVLGQSLMSENGRAIDKLVVEIYKHHILTHEELKNDVIPENEVLGTEYYFFDITAGFEEINLG